MRTAVQSHDKDPFNKISHKEKRESNEIVTLLQNAFLHSDVAQRLPKSSLFIVSNS